MAVRGLYKAINEAAHGHPEGPVWRNRGRKWPPMGQYIVAYGGAYGCLGVPYGLAGAA